MANPKFRNVNDAADEYVWSDLPLEGVVPMDKDRDYQNYEDLHVRTSGEIVAVADRGFVRRKPATIDCSEGDMLEFRRFAAMGVMLFFPDSAVGTNYEVLWQPRTFTPTFKSGGRYEFSFVLVEIE